jgi:hypothetical protein
MDITPKLCFNLNVGARQDLFKHTNLPGESGWCPVTSCSNPCRVRKLKLAAARFAAPLMGCLTMTIHPASKGFAGKSYRISEIIIATKRGRRFWWFNKRKP